MEKEMSELTFAATVDLECLFPGASEARLSGKVGFRKSFLNVLSGKVPPPNASEERFPRKVALRKSSEELLSE
jgi:hypothetical protein